MKRMLAIVSVCAVLTGCVSVEHATVSDREVVTATGRPLKIVQVDVIGFSLFMHMVPLWSADLETVVNKHLVGEAKHMGGTRVEIKELSVTPTGGIHGLVQCLFPIPLILCTRTAHAVGIVIE